ncbi:MAG: ABC transporter transmembrane domain-containing protein, partial [Gammaproteobacteria bacterium]|nr:ABC transporter transmembrane domain-containing protein [Gammaproteobacteria bacterium]
MAEDGKEIDISGSEKKSQNEPVDTGLQCLLAIAQMHSIAVDEKKLRHEYGTGLFDRQKILLAAKDLKMTAKAVNQNIQRLRQSPLPAIGEDKNGSFFLLARVSVPGEDGLIKEENEVHTPSEKWRILLQFPGDNPIVVNIQDFQEFWNGTLLFFTSEATYKGELAKFDFTWFIPAVIRYRRILLEIIIISFFLQIITIITPLFFQVVMDKVLANNALQTLNVIALGLLAVSVYEVLLGGIRTWVFNHTSSKLDVELGARLFRHLLSLPMAYFHARRVGDSVARVRELENIRHFLTSNAVTLILDIFFSIIIIAVMFLYSPKLTWIVVGSIPLYFLVSFVYVPII